MLIMDLDPGEGTKWKAVVEAAMEVRRWLEDYGLAAFLKTSGGKGLHVVTPLEPKADWDAAKAFAKSVADDMAADDPERYVSTITKEKRQGKVLIDYLRNQRGQTAVAPYSTRARKGAPVSLPLEWELIGSDVTPAAFNVHTVPDIIAKRKRDPWNDFRAAAKPLPKG